MASGCVAAEVGVPAHELRSHPVLEPEDVVVHEHLTVAVTPGADADGGHRHGVGDHAGHGVGHALQHDGEHAGLGQRDRVVDDLPRRVERLALHAEATEAVHRLRA